MKLLLRGADPGMSAILPRCARSDSLDVLLSASVELESRALHRRPSAPPRDEPSWKNAGLNGCVLSEELWKAGCLASAKGRQAHTAKEEANGNTRRSVDLGCALLHDGRHDSLMVYDDRLLVHDLECRMTRTRSSDHEMPVFFGRWNSMKDSKFIIEGNSIIVHQESPGSCVVTSCTAHSSPLKKAVVKGPQRESVGALEGDPILSSRAKTAVSIRLLQRR